MDSVIGLIIALIAGLAGWGLLERKKASAERVHREQANARADAERRKRKRAEREKLEAAKLRNEARRIQESTKRRIQTLRTEGITPEQTRELDEELDRQEQTLTDLGL